MNIEERAWVKEALHHIEWDQAEKAREALEKALEVRKPLTVCEKCLKIGSCDCNGTVARPA